MLVLLYAWGRWRVGVPSARPSRGRGLLLKTPTPALCHISRHRGIANSLATRRHSYREVLSGGEFLRTGGVAIMRPAT